MRILHHALAVVGFLACSYWLVTEVAMTTFQAIESRRFSRELMVVHADAPVAPAMPAKAAPGIRPRYGSVIGKLTIPRLGVSTVVVEGAGERELRFAPGHVAGTAFPGDKGNVAVAGHRDTFFRPLRFIRANDAIQLATRDGVFEYHVTSTQVTTPQDLRVLSPTSRPTLTLITCYPFRFVGAAPQRFIIHAEQLPSSAHQMQAKAESTSTSQLTTRR